MQTIIAIGLVALFSYLVQLFFPWWTIAIVAFIIALALSESAQSAFLAGFFGIFLLWFIYAFLIDLNTNSILTQKIAKVFFLPNALLMIIVTGIIGGITGGLGGLTAFWLKKLVK